MSDSSLSLKLPKLNSVQTRRALLCSFAWSAANPLQEKVAHLLRQLVRVAVHARLIPGVNPVHHPEQAQGRRPSREIEAFCFLQVFYESDAGPDILTLEAPDLSPRSVLQDLVLVVQHLHGFLVREEIIKMIQDEHPDPGLRVGHALQSRAQPIDDGRESVPLDQVEQLF